jgi:hypothetical protein
MRKVDIIERRVSVQTEAICNRCGESLIPPELREVHPERLEFYGLQAEVHGGYFSLHLSDCTSYEFDLCEGCLVWLFSTFTLPPTKREYP